VGADKENEASLRQQADQANDPTFIATDIESDFAVLNVISRAECLFRFGERNPFELPTRWSAIRSSRPWPPLEPCRVARVIAHDYGIFTSS
jgi:hypothetical protein